MEPQYFKIKQLGKKENIISLYDVTRLINHDLVPKKKVLVIGGSDFVPGAPLLTLRGAKRCGAKAVAIAAPKSIINKADIMYAGSLGIIEMPNFSKEGFSKIINLNPSWYDCIIVGPGMYFDKKTEEGYKYFLENYKFKSPLIIDANAIEITAKNMELIRKIKAPVILTPNIEEFEELTGSKIEGKNPVYVSKMANKFCQKYGVTLLIKGPIDVITDNKRAMFNIAGQPVLAVSGSGDCLAGCIGGFLSLGNDPFSSVIAGTYVFSRAGDYSFEENGYALDPEIILDKVPRVMREILDFNTIGRFRRYK